MFENFKKNGEIYETTDYSVFKKLLGNRKVTAARAKRIRTSIEKNGYIKSPICVNEKMEVIDGQGRLEALQQLGKPVHFYIEPGAGIKQCITMNIYGTSWGLFDYISSYAEEGDASYIRFKQLYEEYGKRVSGVQTVYFALKGQSMDNNAIKQGRFQCSVEEFKGAIERLEALMPFMPFVQKIGGNKDYMKFAIMFAVGNERVNADRLLGKLEAKYSDIPPISTTMQALKELSTIYNYHARDDRIYLDTDYDKYLRGKYVWYANKWGVKNEVVSEG